MLGAEEGYAGKPCSGGSQKNSAAPHTCYMQAKNFLRNAA